MRFPNPVRSDGFVLQRFVPCPSVDSPEDILEHYRQATYMASIRAARARQDHRLQLLAKEAYEQFRLVQMLVESFRASLGLGTMLAIQGRTGQHAQNIPTIPLTHPGYIHHWVNGEVGCRDIAHAYESAVEKIEHVTCRACILAHYRNRRNRRVNQRRTQVIR